MSKSERVVFGIVSCCILSVALGSVIGNDPKKHFKDFSYNLLLQSDLDEFSIEKGAAIASPFGVGYMLANINEKVYNVSNKGLNQVLNSPEGKVAEEYQAILNLMNKGQMSTSSILYSKDQNISSILPEGSQKLKTETKYVDFIEDWKTTWLTINAKTSNQTNGRLDDQLVPKGGWWGGAFYYFTMGAYINTNHYKSSWTTKLSKIGSKRFQDGLEVPFYEAEGKFPFIETKQYTAISLALKEGKKSVILVLPKGDLVDFLKSVMPELTKNPKPQTWSTENIKKIQIPALNITLLDQHYKKLESLGVNYTFCVDEPASLEVANNKGSFFMGPVVQSHHVRFTPDFFEVASATGSSLNSEEKMKEDASQFGTSPSDAEDTPAGEQIADGSEFILPVEMDPRLAASIAAGNLQVEKVDLIVEDNNDTITAASTSSVEQVAAPIIISSNGTSSPPGENSTLNFTLPLAYPSAFPVQGPSDIADALEAVATTLPPPPPPPTTTQFSSESVPENTLRFDRPFFWFLHDEDMGPLYYGTINSIATYQKEYGIETDEDLWLYDAYKTLLWNCP